MQKCRIRMQLLKFMNKFWDYAVVIPKNIRTFQFAQFYDLYFVQEVEICKTS